MSRVVSDSRDCPKQSDPATVSTQAQQELQPPPATVAPSANNRNAMSDKHRTISDGRSRPQQESQPQGATPTSEQLSEGSRLSQGDPATVPTQVQQELQPPGTARQPESDHPPTESDRDQQQEEPHVDERSLLSDNRTAISDGRDRLEQSHSMTAPTPAQPPRTVELSDNEGLIINKQHQSETRLQPAVAEFESDTVLHPASLKSDNIYWEGKRYPKLRTIGDLLDEMAWCLDNGGIVGLWDYGNFGRSRYYLKHEDYPDRQRPLRTEWMQELIKLQLLKPAEQTQLGDGLSEAKMIAYCLTGKALDKLRREPIEYLLDWMEAGEAFCALGGDLGKEDSIVTTLSGDRPIRLSTLKKKTADELQAYGLELNLRLKRDRAPCYRLLRKLKSDNSSPPTTDVPREYPSEKPGGKWPGSVIPKDFVKPGQEPQLPSGNRIVEIETANDLLAEICWCLDNGGDFVFLYELAHGHLPPRRAYYLRHPEWYWQGMRPVKTALVKELISRRAIWTNDPAYGPGSGCRRFYPTAPEATPQSAIASLEPDTALHPATAHKPAQQESQPQSVIPASERSRPELSQTGTVYAPAQQEPQLQSAVPTSEQLPSRSHPEQSHSVTLSKPAQQESQPQFAIATSPLTPEPPPEFPEWMTAKQAFQALGGDPGDRNSSVSSSDGLKEIKFSTFKKKTSSELNPFGLELSQDRKRRRQPCYRLLKMEK